MHQWNPWLELDAVRAHMDRLLRDAFGRKAPHPERGYLWSPAVDVVATPRAYLIRMELPGLGLEDVRVEVQGRDLLVSGERRCEPECADTVYQVLECNRGPFGRVFSLPPDADPAKIAAALKNGLLILTVPRCPGGRECRSVAVD